MHQISVAVHASLFIARPGVQYGPVGEHGASFLRDMKNISMTLLALMILEGGIGLHAVFFVVILFLYEMHDDVLYPMGRF